MIASPFKKRRLVLGVGAAKAGTSWLYKYFKTHPDVCVSPIKELHYFDCVFGQQDLFAPRWKHRIATLGARIERLKNTPRSHTSLDLRERINTLETKRQAMEFRLKFLDTRPDDHRIYRRYFDQYITREKAFADITPAYGMLSPENFRMIRQQHKDIRLIYMMRDPIERFYSQLRMTERTAKARGEPEKSAGNRFLSVLNRKNRQQRGNYQHTIETLDSVFKPHQIRYFYFEEFFNDTAIGKLCEFIDIPFQSGDYSDKANPSPTHIPLTDEMIENAKMEFAPVYRFCKDRFGRVPQSWHMT